MTTATKITIKKNTERRYPLRSDEVNCGLKSVS